MHPSRGVSAENGSAAQPGPHLCPGTVADEGAGMPPEVRDRIVEPFFSTKLDQGGTGLGLAIANFIIKEHKGLLEFESEPGKGTTVQVKLPAERNK